MTIWLMLIACWIPNGANTHSEYVTFVDFPLQRWMYERASVLWNSSLAPLFFNITIILGARALRSHGSSVGIVSRVRGGFRSSTGARESLFPETTRPALGSTQPPIPRAPGVNRPGPEANNLPSLVSRLRMSGALTPLPLCAYISGTGTADLLPYVTRAVINSLLLVRGISWTLICIHSSTALR
jgi:hypothetical protein